MASGGLPQVIGSVLGAAFKELIRDPPTNNTERSASANWNRNGRQNFKKNTRHFNSNNDVHSKKVVKTLEKLVDTKDEALTQEMIRRRIAEQEVRELQQKLEKVQVTKEQAEKKDATSRKFNPHWRSEGKGGSGRGGYNKWGRGGYNMSNRGDGQLSNRACPFKFNNSSNVESERRDNKVYNKQLFDVSAGACKMNNSTYPDASNFPQFHGPMNARGGPHNIHYRRIRSENRDQKLKQKN